MSLIPRNSLFDFDRLFDDFWAPSQFSADARNTIFSPRVDVHDKEDHYEISAELPGVDKDDIKVTLDNGILTIEAETKKEEKEEKDGKIIRQERRYGQYTRSFNLGSQVHDGDVVANFKDGVLTLTAPKTTPSLPETKRIPIK